MSRLEYWYITVRRLHLWFNYVVKENNLSRTYGFSKIITRWIIKTLNERPQAANQDLIEAMFEAPRAISRFERDIEHRQYKVDLKFLRHSEVQLPPDLKPRLKRKSIVIGAYEFSLDKRTRQLLDKYDLTILTSLLLRYKCFHLTGSEPGNQWALDPKINKGWAEAFASALNTRSIDVVHCAPFTDDQELGAIGDFFAVDLSKYGDRWVIDPPFIEDILERAARKTLEFRDKIQFLFCMPEWTDCTAYRLLDGAQLRKRVYQAHTYHYYDGEKPVLAPFNSVHFTNY